MTITQFNDEGTLTGPGTQNTIRTSTGNETVFFQLRNKTGSEVGIKVWIGDAVDDDGLTLDGDLPAYYKKHFNKIALDSGEFIKVEADTASAVVWQMQAYQQS